jgi:hypothetical protein
VLSGAAYTCRTSGMLCGWWWGGRRGVAETVLFLPAWIATLVLRLCQYPQRSPQRVGTVTVTAMCAQLQQRTQARTSHGLQPVAPCNQQMPSHRAPAAACVASQATAAAPVCSFAVAAAGQASQKPLVAAQSGCAPSNVTRGHVASGMAAPVPADQHVHRDKTVSGTHEVNAWQLLHLPDRP